MCNSFKATFCRSRSSLIASVTLASGALAGVIPTARMRPLSRSWSTWRLYPSTRTLRLLRPWRICPSSTLMRRSLATPLIRLAFPFSSTCTSWALTRLRNRERGLRQLRLFLLQRVHPGFHGLQDGQDQAQRLFSLPDLVPIPIEGRLQARLTHHPCSGLFGYLGQLPPLLVCHHAHDLFERVSHQIRGVFHSS